MREPMTRLLLPNEPAPTLELVPAQALIDAARALVGTRYRHQGREAASGVDCIGFVGLAMRNAGGDLATAFGGDVVNYSRNANPQFFNIVARHATRIDAPVPGGLVLFKWKGPQWPQHGALYTERNSIIHALLIRRQVVEHGYVGKWCELAHSFWKLPGVSYG